MVKKYNLLGYPHWSLLSWPFRWDVEVLTEKFSCLLGKPLSTQKAMGKYYEFLCQLTLLCNIDRGLRNSERSVWMRGKQAF